MTKILFFAGSTRTGSFNQKLAQAAYEYAKAKGVEATLVDLKDYDMPMYNGDIEAGEGLPDKAIGFKEVLSDHAGFFVASPEYNSMFSPLLKNTIDWCTRKHKDNEVPVFKGKVAALGAASPGALGGLRGLPVLRILLSNIGVHVVPAQIAVGQAGDAFDDTGNLKDDGQKAMLHGVVDQLIETAKALSV